MANCMCGAQMILNLKEYVLGVAFALAVLVAVHSLTFEKYILAGVLFKSCKVAVIYKMNGARIFNIRFLSKLRSKRTAKSYFE